MKACLTIVVFVLGSFASAAIAFADDHGAPTSSIDTARPLAAPLVLKPRIVPQVGPSAEVVVADAVVTDSPFLADRTGKRDSTQAFTDALAAVSSLGGGTVFVPAGIYRIDGTLVVPVRHDAAGRGPQRSQRLEPGRHVTPCVLRRRGRDGRFFISLRLLSCVRDLAIWYPSQGFTTTTVRPYPFTDLLRRLLRQRSKRPPVQLL